MSPIVIPPPSLHFSSSAELDAEVGLSGSWASLVSFVISGFLVNRGQDSDLYHVLKYVGEQSVPADIKRLRRSVSQVMRRMGQPVIVKHMFNDHDARVGIAQKSPIFDSAYGQVRNKDPYSYGVGYCSIQTSDDEWIDPNSGKLVTADESPGSDFKPAPKYRGYGPGYLTYIIEPDVPLDTFKVSPSGTLIKIQDQTVVAAWFPEIGDNDLIVNVELDNEGNVANAHERYQAKIASPISIRGRDRRGHREYSNDHGNRHVVNQRFNANLLPESSILYSVEIDR